jgi:hypothetical protein
LEEIVRQPLQQDENCPESEAVPARHVTDQVNMTWTLTAFYGHQRHVDAMTRLDDHLEIGETYCERLI